MRKLVFFICVVLAVGASVAVAVDYIVVDDFDSYVNSGALRLVWKDSLVGLPGGGVVWVNKDANFAVDGNSMLLEYWNTKGPYYSETRRTYSTGQDWSYAGAGVTELEIDWFGDVNNVPDPPMYVKLSDGSTTAQVNPGPNDVTDESQHTWHIPLSDFNDGGVTLSGITAITLGIGDNVGEGGPPYENGTLYFDDIRLYPPRCYPEYGPEADFTSDCRVDVNDLMVVVNDWCKSGGWGPGEPVIEYLFEEGSGTTVANTGTFGSDYDLTIGMSWDENGDPVMEPNNDPCWFNDSDPCRGWTLWFDGELGLHPNYPDGNGGDYLVIPPMNLNSNTVTIAAWIKPDPWLLDAKYEQMGVYTGLVHTRYANNAAGISYGSGGGWTYIPQLHYQWDCGGSQPWWQWSSDIIIPDWRWSMAVLVIEPEQANLYLADINDPNDPNDDVLHSATRALLQCQQKFDSRTLIAGDGSGYADRFFRGQMDAIRVYDYSLSQEDINNLSNNIPVSGIVYKPVASFVDLCVGNQDPCDPCAPIDDQIDFCDWSKFADEWLETKLWPQP